MVEKQVALDILEEIKKDIQEDDSGTKALKTINIYRKNLEIAVNPKIKELVDKQVEARNKYGKEDSRTIKLNKQISKEMGKIYNS